MPKKIFFLINQKKMSENKRQGISLEDKKKIIEDVKAGIEYEKISSKI